MIYVICIIKTSIGKIASYRILDTCSDSTMIVGPGILNAIILNTNIHVVNATTKDNKIILKGWANKLATIRGMGYDSKLLGARYILLARKDDTSYKVVDSENGNILTIEVEHFKAIAKAGNVANYSRFTKIKDAYSIQKDTAFELSIATKYNSFIAKTMLLGIGDTTFDYEIENHEVRLKNYTGKNKDVILPSFITAIMTNSFKDTGVKTIRFNSGLQVIGAKAFSNTRLGVLERVDISETVELIGQEAFASNPKLIRVDGELNTDRFKLLNNKTVMTDRYVY